MSLGRSVLISTSDPRWAAMTLRTAQDATDADHPVVACPRCGGWLAEGRGSRRTSPEREIVGQDRIEVCGPCAYDESVRTGPPPDQWPVADVVAYSRDPDSPGRAPAPIGYFSRAEVDDLPEWFPYEEDAT